MIRLAAAVELAAGVLYKEGVLLSPAAGAGLMTVRCLMAQKQFSGDLL